MAELPIYVTEDALALQQELLQDMEARLSKSIAPADIEMLQVNSRAYYRLLHNMAVNRTARQNLIAFADGVALDYLAENNGVYRLPSSTAATTIRFNMAEGHSGLLIPAGVRVQPVDQKVVFITEFDLTILEGDSYGEVSAYCEEAGTIGNGYATGAINVLLDPQPFVTSITNTTVSNGGADQETDAQLRERYKLSFSSFSTAGPTDAYKYLTLSAHPSIIDVAIIEPQDDGGEPGVVKIYPLLKGGLLPSSEILAQVLANCSKDKARPLCDLVEVYAPTKIDYAIEVEITKYINAQNATILEQVNSNLATYKKEGENKLGRDVIMNQIEALCMLKGLVYNVNLITPDENIVAAKNVFTNCTGITVTIVGSNEG